MTNTEYEAASIAAANASAKFEGEHKLKQIDEHIATLEAALAKAQEVRREIVNFYNLNKPKDCRNNLNGSDSHFCPECTK